MLTHNDNTTQIGSSSTKTLKTYGAWENIKTYF